MHLVARAAMFLGGLLGVHNIFNLAGFTLWFRQLELDTGGIYALVASIVINISAWNFGSKAFSEFVAHVVATVLYADFWQNWFYIPVRALCYLYFLYRFYWKPVRRLQAVAVQNMQQNLYSSTLVILGSVASSISLYFVIYIGISYLPLLVWRIFFNSDLWYNLHDIQRVTWESTKVVPPDNGFDIVNLFFNGFDIVDLFAWLWSLFLNGFDIVNLFAWLSWIFAWLWSWLPWILFSGNTPTAASNLFAWLSWVDSTAYYTLPIDNQVLNYVKKNIFKFAIYAFYAAYAFSPFVLLALFAFLHRRILGNVSDRLQPYYIMIKNKMPLLFFQFLYPFDTWPTAGWRGVALIVFVLIAYKFFH